MTTTEQHPLTVKLREAVDSGDPAKISRTIAQVNRELMQPELWGAVKAAEHLGITHTNMYKLDGLPEPALSLDRGQLWSAYKIREFAKRRKPNN